jgi:hypothetical protein
MNLSGSFIFRPEAVMAHPLLLLIVFLVSMGDDGRSLFNYGQGFLAALVASAALVVTHFYTSLALLVILSGIHAIRRKGRRDQIQLSFIILLPLLIAAWQLYYATPTFEHAVTYISRVRELFLQGKGFFYAQTLLVANAGADVPFWASATRLFWLFAIYAFGGMLALSNLLRLRRLTRDECVWTGGTLGIAVLTVILALLTGTGDQLARYLQWGTFFAVPLVLLFASRALSTRLATAVVCVPLFVLSLPSFLAFHGNESTRRFYSQERSAAEFLEGLYSGADSGLSLFSGLRGRSYYVYYLPNANFHSSIDAVLSRGDASVVWKDLELLVARFAGRDPGLNPRSVFVFDEVFPQTYYHLLGISPSDPGWEIMKARLATTNAFYDDGMVQLYLPASRQGVEPSGTHGRRTGMPQSSARDSRVGGGTLLCSPMRRKFDAGFGCGSSGIGDPGGASGAMRARSNPDAPWVL